MEFTEAKSLFPNWGMMYDFIQPRHLEKLRVVPTELVLRAPQLSDLPRIAQLTLHEPHGFSSFNLPGLEAHFISVGNRVFPNIAHKDHYRSLLDVSFAEAVGDVHWIWFGSNRLTDLRTSMACLKWVNPQTNYQLPNDGPYRRVATSTLLMGREWEPYGCPCGANCLRPDHWRQRAGTGRGRQPRLNIRLERGVKK